MTLKADIKELERESIVAQSLQYSQEIWWCRIGHEWLRTSDRISCGKRDKKTNELCVYAVPETPTQTIITPFE